VIASNSSWTSATGQRDNEWETRRSFYKAEQQAVDRDQTDLASALVNFGDLPRAPRS